MCGDGKKEAEPTVGAVGGASSCVTWRDPCLLWASVSSDVNGCCSEDPHKRGWVHRGLMV